MTTLRTFSDIKHQYAAHKYDKSFMTLSHAPINLWVTEELLLHEKDDDDDDKMIKSLLISTLIPFERSSCTHSNNKCNFVRFQPFYKVDTGHSHKTDNICGFEWVNSVANLSLWNAFLLLKPKSKWRRSNSVTLTTLTTLTPLEKRFSILWVSTVDILHTHHSHREMSNWKSHHTEIM